MESENLTLSYSEDDESLYAEIESNLFFSIFFYYWHCFTFLVFFNKVTVDGEYLFQIVSKKDNRPIPIKVFPKSNNTYKIQFQPLSNSGYIVNAKSLKSTHNVNRLSVGPLNCSFNNPKNLKVNDLVATDEFLAFTGNILNKR